MINTTILESAACNSLVLTTQKTNKFSSAPSTLMDNIYSYLIPKTLVHSDRQNANKFFESIFLLSKDFCKSLQETQIQIKEVSSSILREAKRFGFLGTAFPIPVPSMPFCVFNALKTNIQRTNELAGNELVTYLSQPTADIQADYLIPNLDFIPPYYLNKALFLASSKGFSEIALQILNSAFASGISPDSLIESTTAASFQYRMSDVVLAILAHSNTNLNPIPHLTLEYLTIQSESPDQAAELIRSVLNHHSAISMTSTSLEKALFNGFCNSESIKLILEHANSASISPDALGQALMYGVYGNILNEEAVDLLFTHPNASLIARYFLCNARSYARTPNILRAILAYPNTPPLSMCASKASLLTLYEGNEECINLVLEHRNAAFRKIIQNVALGCLAGVAACFLIRRSFV